MARKKKILSPTYIELIIPTYEALKQLGNSATNEEIYNKIIEYLKLSNDIIYEPHGNNPDREELEYQLAWERTYLKNYGVIKNIKRGMWEITPSFTKDIQLNYTDVVAYTTNKKQNINNNAENINNDIPAEDIGDEVEDNKYISNVAHPNSADMVVKSFLIFGLLVCLMKVPTKIKPLLNLLHLKEENY